MNMTDRERLIDLMIDAKRTDPETGSFTEYLADYLLEHGVIVPPCKAGDMVYMVTTLQKEELIFENIIKRVVYDAGDFAFSLSTEEPSAKPYSSHAKKQNKH